MWSRALSDRWACGAYDQLPLPALPAIERGGVPDMGKIQPSRVPRRIRHAARLRIARWGDQAVLWKVRNPADLSGRR